MVEKKGGEGGGLWLFIAGLALRRGLGLREGEGIDGQGGVMRIQGFLLVFVICETSFLL
jgi:hypothetical protein